MIWSSSEVRSRISFCAVSASFQKSGPSESAFSSARRRCATSQSKMPPQQSNRLLGVVELRLNLWAHDPGSKSCAEGYSGAGIERMCRAVNAWPRLAGAQKPQARQ
ncbi:hypothetical protein B5U98_16095 [Bosea sp. Tri-39]|nr:hypothetical protein B5U98_16095 [Bosea sp. Tri-39]RXT32303.1 hypothetical protein B5U99_26940 [Bosea sp. Tri-54]